MFVLKKTTDVYRIIILLINTTLFLIMGYFSVALGLLIYLSIIAFVIYDADSSQLFYWGVTLLVALGLIFFYSYVYLSVTHLSLCVRYNFPVISCTICLYFKITQWAALLCFASVILVFFLSYFTLDYLTNLNTMCDFILYAAGFLVGLVLVICACDLFSGILTWGILSFFSRHLLLFYVEDFAEHKTYVRGLIWVTRLLDWCLYGALLYIFVMSSTTIFFWTIHTTGYTCYLHHRTDVLVICGIIWIVACFKSIHVFLLGRISRSAPFSTEAALFIYAICLAIAGLALLIHLNYLWCYQVLLQQIICVACSVCASATLFAALRQTTLRRFFAYIVFCQISYLFAAACAYDCTLLFFHSIFFIFIKITLFILSGYLIHACDKSTLLYQTSTPLLYTVLYVSFYYCALYGITGIPGTLELYYDNLFLTQTPFSFVGFCIICCTSVINFVSLINCLIKLEGVLSTQLREKTQNILTAAACQKKFYAAESARSYKFMNNPTVWGRYVVLCHVFFLALSCILYSFCYIGLIEMSFLWFLSMPGMLFITFLWWLFL